MARFLRDGTTRYRFLSNRTSPLCSKRLLETLAYEEIRVSGNHLPKVSTAFIFHGLLGSGRNWRSFARNMASRILSSSPSSDWRFVLLDLRNHRKSAEINGLDPPHNMFNTARDVANLVKCHGWAWPDVVIGHSLGGKVALQFVKSTFNGDYGEHAAIPKQLWVLDSEVGKVDTEITDSEVGKILHTLQKLPSSFPSRKWLVDHMINLGFSKPFSEWIGSNLKNEGEHLTWSFNLEGAIEMFYSYRETSYWSLLEHPPKGLDISIVRAENSDRWSPQVIQQLEFLASKRKDPEDGKVLYHVLPNSGHWMHVDNPNGLLEMIAQSIISMR